MRKSPFDHRTYRHITLANGLPVLVVEDAKSHRAAAAVAVRVGHFFDPPHREGLAHFVEHLLFLGTDTHPGDGEYQSFIQRAGGNHNAWTGTEHSSYFFDVQPNHFSEALWRFSRFFVCPLLQPESVDNERHAIEAEYRLKLQDDTRRLYQVHQAVVNPEHPFSKFSVGNLETLAADPVELAGQARALYERHYHAGNMTLVLYGPQSVAELSSWAHSYFSDIRRGDKVPAFWEGTRLYQNLPFQVSVAIFSFPWSGNVCSRATDLMLSTLASISREILMTSLPASVIWVRCLPLRPKICTPSSSSSIRTCLLIPGCEVYRLSAVAETFKLLFTTSTIYRSCCNFIR